MKVKIAKGGIRMGTWNHRVIEYPDPIQNTGKYLVISEVHYDEKGIARGWADGASVNGDSIEGMLETMGRMYRALRRPILRVKKLDDGAEVLVEADSGNPATNTPIKGLPPDRRVELHAMKEAIEGAVKRRRG